jgi:hypothetical protein
LSTFGSVLWGTVLGGSGVPLSLGDVIGRIPVPNYDVPSSTFPLKTRFPWSRTMDPEIVVHTFGDVGAKIEQRFYVGDGLTKFIVNLQQIAPTDLAALVAFFRSLAGPLQAFYYAAPNDDNNGTTLYTVRFDNAALGWERINDFLANTSVTLIQVPDPNAMPWYNIASTNSRYPSSALETALLDQVQQVVPLITIKVQESGYPQLYLSDRRCNVGGQLYQARLIDFDGISQGLGPSDDVRFRLGNADRVMTLLSNDTDLKRAEISFSLFDVRTGIKLDLWTGKIQDYSEDQGPTFELDCSDRVAELTLQYPFRIIDRSCWKKFNDGQACPAALVGGTNLGTACDKGFDTPAGCQFHSMDNYFGGIVGAPQGVKIRDNGESGRPQITATSIVSDTIYGAALPEVYTDVEFPVNCLIVEGRDESDFYEALGIVGAGPIGSFGANANQLLDGQPNHAPYSPGESLGNDPNPDHFALDELSGWTTPYKAAGVAFIRIRRTDTKGIQPSLPSDHAMQATVSSGLSGFIWTAPGARTTGRLTNPVWVAVNVYLRALALQFASLSAQEAVIDIPAAVAAASICDLSVPSLVYRRDILGGASPTTGGTYGYGNYSPGTPNETQFKFIGTIAEQKPLKDWLDEIFLNCLGYYTIANGKLRIGIRENAGAAEAFTIGNMLYQSLSLRPFQPAYNDITASFADQQFNFAGNTIRAYDEDNAQLIGNGYRRFEKGSINLSATASASQAARVIITRLREEIGGINAGEWKAARLTSWKTTILSLATEPGQVVSISAPDVPGGYIKVRITSWKLNSDYSIEISGRTVTDSMYELDAGPKPADVSVPALPIPHTDFPFLPQWEPGILTNINGRGTFQLATAFSLQPDGSQLLRVTAMGNAPVTQYFTNSRPVIPTITQATAGGAIPGGHDYYFAVVGVDSFGNWSARSNVVRVSVPAGTNTNVVTLRDLTYPPGSVTCYFFAGDDPNDMRSIGTGAISSILNATGLPGPGGYGLPPDVLNVRLRIKAKPALSLGIVRGAVGSVASGYIVVQSGIIRADNQYVGRVLSLLGHAANGAVDVRNFLITSSSTIGNSLSLSPNPLGILASDDLFVIRTQLSAWSSTVLTDPSWVNPTRLGGLAINEDVGKIIRIIQGTGAGQLRQCASNTATSHTVSEPFNPAPDSSSIYTVEDTYYLWEVDSPVIANNNPAVPISVQLSISDFTSDDIVITAVLTSDGFESDETVAPFRELSILTPLAYARPGINLLNNPDFESPPQTSADTGGAGWYLGQNDNNTWDWSRETGITFSGSASVKAAVKAGITYANNTGSGSQFYSRQRFLVKPGESYYVSANVLYSKRSGQPTNFLTQSFMIFYIFYADGSADGAFGTVESPAPGGWTKISGRITIPTDRGAVLYMLVGLLAGVQNMTGGPYTTSGPLESAIYFDSLQFQKVVDGNTLVNGSLLLTQSLIVSVVQNSNSGGSCTIGLSWAAQSIPLSNRDTFNAVASGGARTWTGLAPGTTYYFDLYGLAVDGTIHFGAGDPPATPPSAPDPNSILACSYEGRYALGSLTITTPATSGGTGSGSGGGGSICPEGQELVEALGRGIIKVIDVQVGDQLRGHVLDTNETIYRRVRGKTTQPSSTWRMVNGRRVSPCHEVWVDQKWKQPWQIGSFDTTPGTRVQLTMDADSYDDQNFALVDDEGNTSLIMHNIQITS